MLVVINTQDLLEQGYLSPIEYHDVSLYSHDQIPTNKSKSDFDMEKFDEMLEDRLQGIADYITGLEHKAKLVFCATIDQANELQGMIADSVVVTSETSKKERERVVRELKEGKIKVVLNVGIFTVGFDYPELDCIVLLRPTRSLRLHCQILGRVSRIAEGKDKGHVYDLVGNVKSLGQLHDIRVGKGYDGKWNVMGGMFPDGFHDMALYTHKLKKPKQAESEIL